MILSVEARGGQFPNLKSPKLKQYCLVLSFFLQICINASTIHFFHPVVSLLLVLPVLALMTLQESLVISGKVQDTIVDTSVEEVDRLL